MTRVLVAGVSTRAVAESAARAGFEVTALDAFGDRDQHPAVRAVSLPRDLGRRFDPAGVVRAASELPVDAVAYLSPLENHPGLIRALARGRTLLGNDPDVLRRVRDPFLLMRTLREIGFATPATFRDAPDRGIPLLLKPLASGGGHGVSRWRGGRVPSHAYLQELVEGVAASVVFVAAGGEARVLGVSRQLVGDAAFGAAGYRYCGSIFDGRRDADEARLAEQAGALARAAAGAFGLVGLNGIDFIAHDGRAVPVEINPRWCASMELVERWSGTSLFRAHADACRSGSPSGADAPLAATHGAIGKAVVFARDGVVAGDTQPWLDDPDVRDVPHPGDRIPAGGPVCTVFAAGPDFDACYARLVARAGGIYAGLEAWR